jgi:hypothetical protein
MKKKHAEKRESVRMSHTWESAGEKSRAVDTNDKAEIRMCPNLKTLMSFQVIISFFPDVDNYTYTVYQFVCR